MARADLEHRPTLDELFGPDPNEGFGEGPPAVSLAFRWLFERWKVDSADRDALGEHCASLFASGGRRGKVRLFVFHFLDTIEVRPPSLSLYFRGELVHQKYREGYRVEAIRRELAEAKERAQDRNRSAIRVGLALEVIAALVALVASKAIRALASSPLPTLAPRVLSAGGKCGNFVPLA